MHLTVISALKEKILFVCLFFGTNFNSAILARSLYGSIIKRIKNLACDVFDIFVRHFDLAHGVTDAPYWAQNVSAHGYVFATFQRLLFIYKTVNLFIIEHE